MTLFLWAVQCNVIKTKYIKGKIDNIQQNCNCWLCGVRDETVNHIVSEYIKLERKEFKTRHDWMEKVIHWKSCKGLKFDHTNKWTNWNSSERIHHHVVLLAQISLTLSRNLSLLSIASFRSSRKHLVPVQSYCRYVLAGRPTPARPCEGIHWRTSLTSSPLLFQQYPSCFIRLITIVLEMGGWWPYSCCFVGCCFRDLLNIACNSLMQLPSSFFLYTLKSALLYEHDHCLEQNAFYFIREV